MNVTLRDAAAADIPRLNAIERAAAEPFRGSGLIDVDEAGLVSPQEHAAAIAAGLSIVAIAAGEPIGYAMGERHGESVYLHELDVHPEHGRKGVGAALVEAFCARAKERGARDVVLSTFRDPPWNAPFYRRLGFADLADSDRTGWMHKIELEQALFLDLAARVFMRRVL